MTLNKEQTDFVNHCRHLIGQAIVSVEYAEIIYNQDNPTPYYQTHFSNLDSVDFSIIFKTSENNVIEIYWDGNFHQFGIGLKINKQSDFLRVQKWTVTDREIWREIVGQNIINVDLDWETITATDQSGKRESFTYPQDIILVFENKRRIFISAAGFLHEGDEEVFGMLDNLTVTDNEELARRTKMIP